MQPLAASDSTTLAINVATQNNVMVATNAIYEVVKILLRGGKYILMVASHRMFRNDKPNSILYRNVI